MFNYKIKAAFITLVTIVFGIVFLVVVISMPSNPILLRTNLGKYEVIKSFLPQGYGFFTKDPQLEVVDVYQSRSSTFEKLELHNLSFKNYLGFGRKTRVFYSQIEFVANQIKKEDWVSVMDASRSDEYFSTLVNGPIFFKNIKNPYFDGQLVVRKYKPLPWAWFSSDLNVSQPFEACSVIIKK